MDSSNYDADTLTPPFIGFVVGTALFGVTILQAFQYFVSYPEDSLWCKLRVAAVCLLDALHFVFSANLMYTFLISNFGSVVASTRNVWSFKAIGTTQTILIVFVQMAYLKRIHTLASFPLLVGKVFSRLIRSTIWLIVICAIGVGVVVCYEVQRVDVILSFGNDSEWMIYLGFGATTILDISIALMMCFVLHKNKLDTAYLNQRGDKRSAAVLSTLIKYALASGLLTAFASLLVIVSFVARPNTLVYIAVALSVSRLYTNSLLAMLNVRRQLNAKLQATPDLDKISKIVFFDQHTAHVTSVFLGSEEGEEEEECRVAAAAAEARSVANDVEDSSGAGAGAGAVVDSQRRRSHDGSSDTTL